MKQKILNSIYSYLAFLTRYYLKNRKCDIIWITWSVGKTSCRMIISEILKKELPEKKIYTSNKNFNSELWMVFSIFKIESYKSNILDLIIKTLQITFLAFLTKPKYDILVLEYGIDKLWDMDHLLSIAKPDIWIMTKLDKVHAANYESIDEIWNEKIKLLKNALHRAYWNSDDSFTMMNFDEIKISKSLYFGEKNSETPNFKDYILNKHNWIKAKFNVNTHNWSFEIETNLLWKENSLYISLAYQILEDNFGFTDTSNKSLELSLQPWRFSILEWINDSILIDSSYNAAPLSMAKMIDNAFNLKNQLYPEKKIILCIWDMRELWDFSEEEHKNLAWKIMWWADILLTVWPEMEHYLLPELKNAWFNGEVKSFWSSRKAWEWIRNQIISSDEKYIIFFKGSQNTIFTEEAVKECLKNPEYSRKLCRQSPDWIKKKNNFFNHN